METAQRMDECEGDIECSSSNSSMVFNDEVQSTTQKTGTQESEVVDKNIKKDVTNADRSEHFQKLVQHYKQISGNVKYKMKNLEAKWQKLNATLIQKKHECAMLNKQKEFQGKTLVDLQIRLENLDTERVKIMEDCQKDKAEKTEVFTHELQSLLENYEYISKTNAKYGEIIKMEKQGFDNLLKNAKDTKDYHLKAGEDYYKKLKETITSFQNNYDQLIKEEENLTEELYQSLVKCKSLKEDEMKVRQEILQTESRFQQVTENHEHLKISLEQKKNLLHESEITSRKLISMKENELEQLNLEVEAAKKICERVHLECLEKCDNLSKQKSAVVELQEKHNELVQQLAEFEKDSLSKQEEIFLHRNECQLIMTQLEEKKLEEASLKALEVKQQSLSDTLNNLKLKKSSIQEAIVDLQKEIASKEEIQVNLKKNEVSLKDEKEELAKIISEWQLKVAESEKEFSNLLQSAKEHCVLIGNKISVICGKQKELEAEIEKNEIEDNHLDTEIKCMEEKIGDFKLSYTKLIHSKEESEEETKLLDSIEEVIAKLNVQYEESQAEAEKISSELTNITKQLENFPRIDELESELSRMDAKLDEATLHHKEELSAADISHQTQLKHWENNIIKEIKEIERRTRKEQARSLRMSEATPRLERELAALDEELKQTLPSLLKEVQSGLQVIEQLANFYYRNKKSKKKVPSPSLLWKLQAIEEHLAEPMKHMAEGVPDVDMHNPKPNDYKIVINAFKEKYNDVFKRVGVDPPLEIATKLREVACCIYGKKWVEPSNSQACIETEISSSTGEVVP